MTINPTTTDPTVATLHDRIDALRALAVEHTSEHIINWTNHVFLFDEKDYAAVRETLPGIPLDEASGVASIQTHICEERWR